MNQYTYDFEVQTMSTMFINAFSDIIINRFDVNKQTRNKIKTRVVYAPKQRVLNDLLNRDQNLQLPVVSVNIGGISRDENRVFNKILGTYHTPLNASYSIHEPGVLPVDVTFNVSIMTRYQQDMDQILSHLLPYVNPYFVISWRTPNRPDHEIRSKVLWNGSINIQYPNDLNANQTARVIADLTFTFQGWLFQQPAAVENIYTFNTTYINAGAVPFETLLETDRAMLSTLNEVNIRNVIYSAAPPQPKFVDPVYASSNMIQDITLWGPGLETTTNLYVSGLPVSATSTLQDPFSAILELSAAFPSFSATKIPMKNWNVDKEEGSLTFTTSPATLLARSGVIDIIVENARGYGKLTRNVPINRFNPYSVDNPLYDSWVYVQLPYLSGLQVI
jgi:hypothetical protein